MIYYIMGLFASFLSSIGQIYFKMSGTRTNNSWIGRFLNKYFVLGNSLFMISMLISIYALSKIDFSSYYSLTASNYIFVTILSRIILKESVDNKKMIGNAFIIAGIIVYNIL
jgi:drug/metabolite transporter (DMT)-like permease